MKLLDALVRGRPTPADEARLLTPAHFGFGGHQYPLTSWQGAAPDVPDSTFLGYISSIHQRNGVVAAAVETRALLLSQLRFEWMNGNGERTTNRASTLLNRPGSMTRPNFLKQLEYDASYSGAAHIVRDEGGLRRLRPDRCSFLLGSDSDPTWEGEQAILPYDAEVLALLYNPSTTAGINEPQVFFPGEFVTWAPEPDPINFWRGTSWVTAVMREIVADGQATDHQRKFFENAATPNLVFIMDPTKTSEQVAEYAKIVNQKHSGSGNAYKNMYLGGGTDVKVVGASLDSINLKDLTGGLENRIAIRSRIPAVVLGAREGLSGSSLNAGNYGSARRLLADGWFSPTAESLCAALEQLVSVPNGSELVYDASRVLFLQEDEKDAADIIQTNSSAMRQLIDAGYDPATVTEAVTTGNLAKLVHTGNVSVQLQPAGAQQQSNSAGLLGEVRALASTPSPSLVVHNHVTEGHTTIENRVEPTPVTIENRVEPTPVTVNHHSDVHVPEQRAQQAPPVINVNVDPTPVTVANTVNVEPTPVAVTNVVETPLTKHRVKRDSKGNITEITEEPA